MRSVSVTQLNEYIANKLRDDYNLRNIPVKGEISGFSKSGQHYYFTLKDEQSMVKCAIWGSNAAKIDMSLLENGKKIIALGDISPYPRGGSYSFSVKMVEVQGIGDLMAEFNRIKELLQKEGLFDEKYKKPIPEFPYRIGVVTSDAGAAIEDIKKVITTKNKFTDIIIFPTLVQGIGAAESIIENIELANRLVSEGYRIDTLIVGRGGGSAEDLMAFNDENVARAIFDSVIPVISAVGHESDFSISDFVADVRAATPTKAAEMAVMDTDDIYNTIEESIQRLDDSINYKLQSERNLFESRLELIRSSMLNKITDTKHIVDKALISLKENNPAGVFAKGYSAVIGDNNKIMASVDDIEVGSTYKIIMKDGKFEASVTVKERN